MCSKCKPDPSHFMLCDRCILGALASQLNRQQIKNSLAITTNRWLLSSLHTLPGSHKDGSVHWQRPGKEPEVHLPYLRYRAPSAEVEMTAYALLAHLTTQLTPSQEELSFASLIAKWITGQQNPNGGFSSTQVSCFPPATSRINARRWEASET